VVVIPRADQCCKEDIDTSGYKGKFIDVGIDEIDIVEDEKDKEELVI